MNYMEMEHTPHKGLPNIAFRTQINIELYYLVLRLLYYSPITFHKAIVVSWSVTNYHLLANCRQCGQAEQKKIKTMLQVHYLHMKDLLSMYICRVREERADYFNNLIMVNKHKPKFLFSNIDSLVVVQG